MRSRINKTIQLVVVHGFRSVVLVINIGHCLTCIGEMMGGQQVNLHSKG